MMFLKMYIICTVHYGTYNTSIYPVLCSKNTTHVRYVKHCKEDQRLCLETTTSLHTTTKTIALDKYSIHSHFVNIMREREKKK